MSAVPPERRLILIPSEDQRAPTHFSTASVFRGAFSRRQVPLKSPEVSSYLPFAFGTARLGKAVPTSAHTVNQVAVWLPDVDNRCQGAVGRVALLIIAKRYERIPSLHDERMWRTIRFVLFLLLKCRSAHRSTQFPLSKAEHRDYAGAYHGNGGTLATASSPIDALPLPQGSEDC